MLTEYNSNITMDVSDAADDIASKSPRPDLDPDYFNFSPNSPNYNAWYTTTHVEPKSPTHVHTHQQVSSLAQLSKTAALLQPMEMDDTSASLLLQNTDGEKSTCTTRNVGKRKRIYGEEYRELTVLNAQPQAKLLKLEQSDYEIVVENFTKKYLPGNNNNTPEPTATTTTTILPKITAVQTTTQSIPMRSKCVLPTFTNRNYIIKELNLSPQAFPNNNLQNTSNLLSASAPSLSICLNCFSVTCICKIIKNKNFK